MALAELAEAGQPEGVRAAAGRLSRLLPDVSDHPATLAGILDAAGARRDREIFVARTLRLRNRPTIEDVGRRFGISSERVRQIRARAEQRVRSVAANAPAPFQALVASIPRWLGAIVPFDAADDLARRLGAGSASTDVGGLLLWLAGPYQPVRGRGGWLALDPRKCVADIDEWLAQDGGVRPVQEIRDELAAAGVRPEHRDAWLAVSGAIEVDGMAVHTVGALPTVVERVLFAAGRGMTSRELGGVLATTAAANRVIEMRSVLRSDRRFVQVAHDVYELAEWGGVATTDAEPLGPGGGAEAVADDRWWLALAVDERMFHSARVPVPPDSVEAMPPAVGHRRTFTSRFGPVTIVHDRAAPALGSLRHVLLACGAKAGDQLCLGFDPLGEVRVRLAEPDTRPVLVMAEGAQ